ncbi:MAG: UDP-2,3-diacylglucosamine diphosphatase LpxI [Candidatus Omnitrophica bacterium]|nr:UDP-2,3-diacylglucosamine diphosphatase LpxI [Candidatus Omnitrophota bacterium]
MSETDNIKRIGLIAGNGKFPIFLCRAAKEKNIQVVAIAIKDETDKSLSEYADKIYWVELGQVKSAIELLKKEGLRQAVMAGAVKKITALKQTFKMDEVARGILKNSLDKKDNTLLRAVADRLREDGIELLDSTALLKNFLIKKGVYTAKKPTASQAEDIDFGFKIAKQIALMDIGQTIAVKNKAIIAVEAIEGTDEAILRAGSLVAGTVIVKVAREGHDMRFDVPAVGLSTIKTIKAAKAAVLAIEAEKTLVLDKDEVIKQADKLGICVVAV